MPKEVKKKLKRQDAFQPGILNFLKKKANQLRIKTCHQCRPNAALTKPIQNQTAVANPATGPAHPALSAISTSAQAKPPKPNVSWASKLPHLNRFHALNMTLGLIQLAIGLITDNTTLPHERNSNLTPAK